MTNATLSAWPNGVGHLRQVRIFQFHIVIARASLMAGFTSSNNKRIGGKGSNIYIYIPHVYAWVM